MPPEFFITIKLNFQAPKRFQLFLRKKIRKRSEKRGRASTVASKDSTLLRKKNQWGSDFLRLSKIPKIFSPKIAIFVQKNKIFFEKTLDKFQKNLYHSRTNAAVAQLVERWTENPYVVGSIPTGGKVAFHNATFFMHGCFCFSESCVENFAIAFAMRRHKESFRLAAMSISRCANSNLLKIFRFMFCCRISILSNFIFRAKMKE